MRSTCEIIADIKDNKEVSYEELRMACLVQASIIFFYQQDTKSLLKGGISAELTQNAGYSDSETSSRKTGCPSWYWKAIKMDPAKFLGPRNTPGTEEWKNVHFIHQKIFDKCMKEIENGKDKD